MLEFPESRVVTLTNFQARNEVHGKDLVPAVDLGISVKGSNRLLDLLHPQLRPALFRKGEADASSAEPELDLPVYELPHVRVPRLAMPLKIDYEQTGMYLEIAYGTARKPSNIVLGLVRLHKVRIEALAEGGSVELRFTLSCADLITESIAGRLAILQGHDIEVTLQAPEVVASEREALAEDAHVAHMPMIEEDPAPTVEEMFARNADEAERAGQ